MSLMAETSCVRHAVTIVLLLCSFGAVFVGTSETDDGGYQSLIDAVGLASRSRDVMTSQRPTRSTVTPGKHKAQRISKPATTGHDAMSRQERSRMAHLCGITQGTWCWKYHKAPALPFKPVPRGSKSCHKNCSGVGNCNADWGLCECPAGYGGGDCSRAVRRPCAHRHAERDEVHPISHIDKDGRDLDWSEPGWLAGRCAGICDDDTGMCWCDGKYKHIPAPKGSPYGTPPVQYGRPMADSCKPNADKDGKELDWGFMPYTSLYGDKGWCDADKPSEVHRCACAHDGGDGDFCEVRTEMFCVGQCSGHGECIYGFCKCHPGWYGQDCSRKVAGQQEEPGLQESQRPWIKPFSQLAKAALAQPAAGTTRKRPFIYVYDMPPAYTSRMLQYRMDKASCTWRVWGSSNESILHFDTYGIEVLLHEMLLQSDHRTFDPEEADFFYVPVYTSCYSHPVYGYLDGPWWHAPKGSRPSHMSMMTLEAKRWLQQTYPFWNRTGGADHVWLFSHDEGACWAPSEVANTSIILTHWGRQELNHSSNTAYGFDNYTIEHRHPKLQPDGWLKHIKGHPCYNASKDLVVPAYKPPFAYGFSPYVMGNTGAKRDILAFFKGDMGQHREAHYSRGLRQRVYNMSRKHDWRQKYNILIGGYDDMQQEYGQLLARSVFCLVMPGDGWSPRAEDAVLHGCIPVVVMDNVHAVFESILDWDTFGMRIRESSVEHLPEILMAVPDDRIQRMQRALAKMWHRFAYLSHPKLKQSVAEAMESARQRFMLWEDDALGTIMQWLHSRIDAVKSGAANASEDKV